MEWVRNQLDPALRNAGLRVCLDVRDFDAGKDKILEIERGGLESRCTLCVISPEYFEQGRLVEFESLTARRRDPAGRNSLLIPLIVRDTKIPERIEGLIPVTWVDPSDHQREWRKLLQVLGAPNLDAPPPTSITVGPRVDQRIERPSTRSIGPLDSRHLRILGLLGSILLLMFMVYWRLGDRREANPLPINSQDKVTPQQSESPSPSRSSRNTPVPNAGSSPISGEPSGDRPPISLDTELLNELIAAHNQKRIGSSESEEKARQLYRNAVNKLPAVKRASLSSTCARLLGDAELDYQKKNDAAALTKYDSFFTKCIAQ